jgi:hypothetical protein
MSQQEALQLLTPQARKVFDVIRRHSGERLTYLEIVAESGVPLRTVRRTAGKGGYLERHAPALGVIPLRFQDPDSGRFLGLGWQVATPEIKPDAEVATLVDTPDGYAMDDEVDTPDGKGDSGGGHPRARPSYVRHSLRENIRKSVEDEGENEELTNDFVTTTSCSLSNVARRTYADAEQEFVTAFQELHDREPRPDEYPEHSSVFDLDRAIEQLRVSW